MKKKFGFSKDTKMYQDYLLWKKKNKGLRKEIPQKFLSQKDRNPNCWCEICNKGFYLSPIRKRKGDGRFCSYKCMGAFKKGKQDPNLTYRFPKGNKPWNTGRLAGKIVDVNKEERKCKVCENVFITLLSVNQLFCSKDCVLKYQRSRPWSELSYENKHRRIHVLYGMPKKCEHCGTEKSKKFEWANISRKYREERSDWARLCCKCHRRYDRGIKNKIEKICV